MEPSTRPTNHWMDPKEMRTLLPAAADEGAVLHPGHVVWVGAVEIAAGELFLVEPDESAVGHGLGAQRRKLLLAAVDPDDAGGAGLGCHLVNPRENGLVLGGYHLDASYKTLIS